jgi:hypothetical protein
MTTDIIDFRKVSRLIQENRRRKEILRERIKTRLLWVTIASLTIILIFI